MDIITTQSYIRLENGVILTKNILRNITYLHAKGEYNTYTVIAYYMCCGMSEEEHINLWHTDTEANQELKLNVFLSAMEKILNS